MINEMMSAKCHLSHLGTVIEEIGLRPSGVAEVGAGVVLDNLDFGEVVADDDSVVP